MVSKVIDWGTPTECIQLRARSIASLGSKLGCAAGVLCMLAASSAKANIVFCNEFPAEV